MNKREATAKLVEAGVRVRDEHIHADDLNNAIRVLAGTAGDKSKPGNYYFKLSDDWSDDWYSFRAGVWTNAAGDIFQEPDEAIIRKYFSEGDEAVSVEIEWRNSPDYYGNVYDCPDK